MPLEPFAALGTGPYTPEAFLAALRQPHSPWTHRHVAHGRVGVQYLEVRFLAPTALDTARLLISHALSCRWVPYQTHYRMSQGPLEVFSVQFMCEAE